MRVLKTKFPCRHCGVPCEVKRLYEGPYASCATCSEKGRHARGANWRWENAKKKFDDGNESSEFGIVVAERMADVIEEVGAASSHAFKIAALEKNPVHSAQWVRAAISWLKWSENISRQVREMVESDGNRRVVLERIGLKLIPGGLDAPKENT